MYVSRAVQTIRDDPVPDETVTLLVTPASDVGEVRAALEPVVDEHGGEIADELAFETLAVTVPQEAVEAVCATDGIEAVETDATLSMTPDGAGEDVSFEE